jgi:opacity protein-like surface antigen
VRLTKKPFSQGIKTMSFNKFLAFGTFAVATFAAPALAQSMALPEAGRFSGSVTAGIEVPVGGDVHGGGTSGILALGALNPALTGVNAELRVQSRSFDDIYGETTTYGVEGAYGVSDRSEIFGALRMSQADEARVQVGNAVVTSSSVAAVPAGTTLPAFGQFGEYNVLSLEAGYRQYFDLGSSFTPYVAGRVGVARIDEIKATFTVPAAGITLANVPFYDETTTFVTGIDLGVVYAPNDRFSVGVETGLRYTAGPDDNDTGIGPLGLGSINNEGERLSVPVMVRASFKF